MGCGCYRTKKKLYKECFCECMSVYIKYGCYKDVEKLFHNYRNTKAMCDESVVTIMTFS